MPSIRSKQTVVLLGALSLLLPAAVWSANDAPLSPNTIVVTGITKPSEERKLAFALPGVVADVAIKDGDVVKKGQILASQDDRQEQFALKSDAREANSEAKVTSESRDEDHTMPSCGAADSRGNPEPGPSSVLFRDA